MKQEVSRLVEDCLADLLPVLALRGADSLAREGGDLDFIVPSGTAVTACRAVAAAAMLHGWFVSGYRNIGYLAQIILVRPGSTGIDDAIKLDFFNGLHWYGVGRDMCGERLFKELLPAQQRAERLAGAVSFFQKLLVVGQCTSRDWRRVLASGADVRYLQECASALGLPITLAQTETHGVRGLAKWRLRAASGGAVDPVTAVLWFCRCSVAHLRLKLTAGSGMGLVLGISGLDGSGKSTLLARLMGVYQTAGGEQPELMHLLPSWIPLPHQLFRRARSKASYTRPYSEPPVASKLNGALRLSYYLVAFGLARYWLWWGRERERLILLDRSFLDFVSDLPRARIPAQRLPAALIRMLMPKGQLFFLNASPESAVARKGELTLEKARSLQKNYLDTCDAVGAILLDGDRRPDAVFVELLGHISGVYLARIQVEKAHQ